ncbi:MAG: protein-glutamate O-methyltransferase CheR [Pelolinea sp.]|nr:protein-glutamate O-methyltransferase CheR [Pelolinea sp.]
MKNLLPTNYQLMKHDRDYEGLELELLIESIYKRYGFDFREYAPASLRRRVLKCVKDEKLNTISGLQELVLHDPACMKRLLRSLTVDVTSMFRDPHFYVAIRKKVLPQFRNYPLIRIWHAGCATGEEVYSLAILLKEEGLYDRALIYATDMNDAVLAEAKEGIYPLNEMRVYSTSYHQAGGREEFSKYYTAKYGHARIATSLQKNIVWAMHNLTTDSSFNEFHLILCRNVMIYFNRSLQDRVHNLLYDSLIFQGVLGLGAKESIHSISHEADYNILDKSGKLYQKLK